MEDKVAENQNRVQKEEVYDMIQKEVRESIEERFERDRRQNNVIVFGIPPSADEKQVTDEQGNVVSVKISGSEKRQYDLERIEELKSVHDDFEIEENEIKRITRLGSSGGYTSNGRPKYAPICIEFREIESKKKFLQAGKHLKFAESEQLKYIYVAADLTKKQREERQKLFSELNSRKQAGEQNIYISRGKIVKGTEMPRVPSTQNRKTFQK